MTTPYSINREDLPLRVLIVSDSGHGGKIYTATDVLADGKVAVQVRVGHIVYFAQSMVIPIRCGDSIRNGAKFKDLVVTVDRSCDGTYMPEGCGGKSFHVCGIHKDGIMVIYRKDGEDKTRHFIPHDLYTVLDKSKRAWIVHKSKGIYRTGVVFSHTIDGTPRWMDGDQIIRDTLVYDDITDALDFARCFENDGKIKVQL